MRHQRCMHTQAGDVQTSTRHRGRNKQARDASSSTHIVRVADAVHDSTPRTHTPARDTLLSTRGRVRTRTEHDNAHADSTPRRCTEHDNTHAYNNAAQAVRIHLAACLRLLMILSRRSVRAGLGIPSNSPGVPEPRGDLNVMLSMRMQGMLHSPVKSSFNLADDTGKPEQNGSTEETAMTPRPSSASDPLTNWR